MGEAGQNPGTTDVSARGRKLFLLAGMFAAIGFLGYLDSTTGPEISFGIFYLVPIAVGTWYTGRAAGVALSLSGGAAWFFADVASGGAYSHAAIRYWNAVVLLGFFLITTLMLSWVRMSFVREQQLSRVDFLTGISNARAFHSVAEMELRRARRYQRPLTLAYLDIDDFKRVNDESGHPAGDALLIEVARTIQGTLRKTDSLARVGGDEFAILLPETPAPAARLVLDKLRRVLLDLMRAYEWPVTFSIGAVTFTEQPDTLDIVIREADRLMYTAKRNGKNQIATAEMGG